MSADQADETLLADFYDPECAECRDLLSADRLRCPVCGPAIRASDFASEEDVCLAATYDVDDYDVLYNGWESSGRFRRLVGDRVLQRWASSRAAAAAEERESTKKTRDPVSKRLRFEVFKRDGFACGYCGRTPPAVLLECDHVDPVTNGGPSEIDNLVTACFDCNRGKADKLLTDIPQSMAARAAETLEREEQIAGYQTILRAKRLRLEGEVQEVINAIIGEWPGLEDYGIPKRDSASIKRFLEKLGVEHCLEAVSRAGAKCRTYSQGFKYFCGCCWGMIRDRDGAPS